MQKTKTNFRNKIEDKFCSGNPHQAWEGLNKMMDRAKKKKAQAGYCTRKDSLRFVNELNHLYGCFDFTDAKR